MHRSGTSAVTELLIAGGLDAGPIEAMLPASPANERGHFERVDVMRLNDALLEAVGAHWVAPPADPATLAELAAGPLGDEARALIGSISATAEKLVVKDPRFCITLPFWLEAVPLQVDAVVLMYRDPREVAASLRVRDGLPDALGMYLWGVYNTAALAAARDLPVYPIGYTDLLHDASAALEAFEAAVPAFSLRRICEGSSLVGGLHRQRVAERDGLEEPAASVLAHLQTRGPGRITDDVALLSDPAVQIGLSAVAVAERQFRATRNELQDLLLSAHRELEVSRSALAESHRQRDGLASERDALAAERDALVVERDALVVERDGLVTERDVLVTERDALVVERDVLVTERDVLAVERDVLAVERDEAHRQLAEIAAADPLEGADPLVRRLMSLKQRVGSSWIGKRVAPIYRRLIRS